MMAQRKLFLLAAAMLASWAMPPVRAAAPFMNLTVKVTLEEPPCVLNDNKPIIVDFREVIIQKINQGLYSLPIDYSVNCEGKTKALTLTIAGTGAGFNTDFLGTSQTGLAIDIQNSGQSLPPNTALNFTAPDVPTLYAVLVKEKNAVLEVGSFHANARMVVDYQ